MTGRPAVTLAWDDGEAAAEFLRLADELRENGYLSDADQDRLAALAALAEVSSDDRAG